jgi:hypothetical protein
MSTLKERLALVSPEWPWGKKAALAKHCGVKAPSVSDWISGETKTLEGDNLLRAADFLGVNPKWLASGKGPMLRGETGGVAEPEASYTVITPPEAIRVLAQALQAMAPAARESAATLLASMARNPEGQWADWLADLIKTELSQNDKTNRGMGLPLSDSSNSAPTMVQRDGAMGAELKMAFDAAEGEDESKPGGVQKQRSGGDP